MAYGDSESFRSVHIAGYDEDMSCGSATSSVKFISTKNDVRGQNVTVCELENGPSIDSIYKVVPPSYKLVYKPH